jgi:hypothetical protein
MTADPWQDAWNRAEAAAGRSHPVTTAENVFAAAERNGNGRPPPAAPTMHVYQGDQLPEPVPPSWLCVGWIPWGATTVLVGDEGIGKSLWWVMLVSAITTGTPIPSIGLPARAPRAVVLVITEDSAAEVMARLRLAGADLRMVHFVASSDDLTGSPLFPQDMPTVQTAVTKHRAALVVVDGWLDTVPGNLRVKDPQQAREALHAWREMTAATGTAALLLTHTNRLGPEFSLRDRVGATAILRQKARMLLYAATHPDDVDSCLYIGPDKTNSSSRKNAVRFALRIEQIRTPTTSDPGTAAVLEPNGDQGMTIAKLLAEWYLEQLADRRASDRGPTAAERAAAWLSDYLTSRPDRQAPASVLLPAGKGAGHSERALRSALVKLGGRSANSGSGTPWWWSIPVADDETDR